MVKVPAPSAATLAGSARDSEPPVTHLAAAVARAKPRGFRRSRLRTATAAAVVLTAAIAFIGLRGMNPARPGHPAAATGTQSGSATIPAGGGADVAAPVEVTASGPGRTASPHARNTPTARAESLAVTATQPGDAGRSGPSRSRLSRGASATLRHPGTARAAPASSPSASSSPSGPAEASGILTVTPGQLDLAGGTEGQITLTAADGPVSWSASTTSGWLTLSSSQGTLQTGQSVTLTVTVSRNAGHGGHASVVVDWSPVTPAAPAVPAAAPVSSQAVQVSWAADPQPDPSPSPSGSASSSAPPSPAASSLMGQ